MSQSTESTTPILCQPLMTPFSYCESARRPASVIRTRATSIFREPATTRSAVAVATGAASYDHLRDYSDPPAEFILRSMGELLDLIDRLRASNRA